MAKSHETVLHGWAHGRDGKGFNVYAEGPRVFSYGSHYLLGYRAGEGLFFLNGRSYSISTSKHQSYARRATFGEVYTLPDLTAVGDYVHSIARYAATGETVYMQPRDAARAIARKFRDVLASDGGTREAIERLARMAGMTAGQTAAMIAKATRDAKAEAAKRERELAARARRDAIAYAAVPNAEWQSRFDVRLCELRGGSREALSRINMETLSAIRHHRAANASGLGKRTVATIWNRLKQCRAALKEHKANAERREARATMRRVIHSIRETAKLAVNLGDATPAARLTFWQSFRANMAALAETHAISVPAATRERAAALVRIANAEKARAQRERDAAEAERQKEALAAWRAGGARYYGPSPFGGAAIRATHVERDSAGDIIGGTLETSHGASVPLVNAIKAFRFVKMCREAGREWHRNWRTVRVGFYQIDSISAAGDFKAGCHEFKWPEIERLARELGVLWASASDSAVESSH